MGAVLAALLLAGCTPTPDTAAPPITPAPVVTAEQTATATPTPTPTPTPPAVGLAPASVTIPSIGLTESLIDLGIGAGGTMEVPGDFARVGWFTGGGRPGGHGPLVIAGHVDSPSGPAVFVRLRDLVPGDAVEVTDVAGAVHRYSVVEVADYPKSAFPTARVFGAVATDELRLITCGGYFDRSIGHYEDNRVVYAVRDDG
ncbi:class F sortase [Planococcus sp. APC 4015]|nr:class F sortase [Planococcus sp. APC 4015]